MAAASEKVPHPKQICGIWVCVVVVRGVQATWRIYKDPYNALANSTTWRAFWSAFCTFNLAIMGSSILPMPYAFSKTGQAGSWPLIPLPESLLSCAEPVVLSLLYRRQLPIMSAPGCKLSEAALCHPGSGTA